VTVTNWGGNVTFAAHDVRRPSSEDELAQVITAADRVRALGSGHSFNRIADTSGTLVSLAGMPRVFEVAPDRQTVRVGAGLTLGALATLLHDAGLAIPTLPSLTQLTVTGAVVTATHGSGVSVGSLATTVRAIRFVTATGQPAILTRRHRDFDGAVVNLGALGIITELEITVEPTFDVEQRVYDGLAWDALVEQIEPILASAYGVSVFTAITGPSRVWMKRRVGDPVTELPGMHPADGPQHTVRGLDPTNCTDQTGRPGPWHERLPHFRPEFNPSTGAELQTEYLFDARHAAEALRVIERRKELIAPRLLTMEIRAVAADEHWLSPAFRRPSVGIHFTWRPDATRLWPVLAGLESALRPLAPRPHWGKLFAVSPAELSTRYPRWAEYRRLRHTFDPERHFGNAMMDSYFPG
jgi:xylitol oxidase